MQSHYNLMARVKDVLVLSTVLRLLGVLRRYARTP